MLESYTIFSPVLFSCSSLVGFGMLEWRHPLLYRSRSCSSLVGFGMLEYRIKKLEETVSCSSLVGFGMLE